jgi:hypothetical protein
MSCLIYHLHQISRNVENPDKRRNAPDNKNCSDHKPIHRSPDQRSRGAYPMAQLRAKSENTRAGFVF